VNINFSAWSIRKPVPSILLFFVLCVLGLLSFSKLPVTRFPNIDVPLVSVTITQSGAAPSELESQVSKRVEDAVANITGVKHVLSTLTDGQSQTVIEFRLEVNTDRAVNDVKDAIAKIRADLPRTIDEPIIQRIDVEGQSILSYGAFSAGMTLEQLSWHVDDVVARELQGLKGVGRVDRYGGVDREIRHLARSRPAAGARHHGRRGQPPDPRDQCRSRRRARRGRRAGTGDPHARRRAQRRGAGRHQDHAVGRARGPAQGARPRRGQQFRAALLWPARQEPGRVLRRLPL
jgi:hypothetical protein